MVESEGAERTLVDFVECQNLKRAGKSPVILTGIGFLDHMIDQFNSHAQIGIHLTVANLSNDLDKNDRNRHKNENQAILMEKAGSMIGKEFRNLLESTEGASFESSFSCPLDEALVDCTLSRISSGPKLESGTPSGKLRLFELAPFGKYPAAGRKFVGSMETSKLETFFQALARESNLEIQIKKVRGDNAHHIIESTFKAVSRAMRNMLDGVDALDENAIAQNYKNNNWEQYPESERTGLVERKTKETSIEVDLSLDGGKKGVSIDTGISALDDFFHSLFTSARASLKVKCHGDLWIDEHHTAEDVSIAIGQALDKAFGTKAGLNRMWCANAEVNDSCVRVVMDLSNRPCFTHNLSLDCGIEKVDDLTIEMFDHALDSLVVNSRMTVHIIHLREGSDAKSTLQATAIAFGKALKYCATVDRRRAGATASSKGTLSV